MLDLLCPPQAALAAQPSLPQPLPASEPAWSGAHADKQFVVLLGAYRHSGGLARFKEVLTLTRQCRGAQITSLARWIDQREVIGLEWRADTWLPLFQFDRQDMTPRPALRAVFNELSPIFDAWDMANWFAQPSPWLANRTPVQVLDENLPGLLAAARFDRHLARPARPRQPAPA